LAKVALPLDDWFVDKQTGHQRSFGFDQPDNKVSLFFYLSVSSSHFRFAVIHSLPCLRASGYSSASASPALASPAIDAQGVPVSSAPIRDKFVQKLEFGVRIGGGNESMNVSWTKFKSDFKFQGENDIVGSVLLEIPSASDLPRLLNSAF
jgi:tetrahydromethanopterin S-methyltransferase subunit H